MNFSSDFCPTIDICAFEVDHVSRQSRDLFRGLSFGVYNLLAKLSKVSMFCSFVNKRKRKKAGEEEFLFLIVLI